MDFSAITDSGRAAATVKVGKEFIYLFIFFRIRTLECGSSILPASSRQPFFQSVLNCQFKSDSVCFTLMSNNTAGRCGAAAAAAEVQHRIGPPLKSWMAGFPDIS